MSSDIPAEPATGKPSSSQPRLRVLVAEDNVLNQRVASGFLKVLGCEVTIAANGREALDSFRVHCPDIVLMDCNMPELDGFEATRRMRSHELESGLARTPIIALTAHAFSEIVQQCHDAGMDEHLAKPIMLEDLRSAIDRHRPATG